MQDFNFPQVFKANEVETARGKEYAKLITNLLATGKVRPNATTILPKGLASVPEGMQYMRDGKVSDFSAYSTSRAENGVPRSAEKRSLTGFPILPTKRACVNPPLLNDHWSLSDVGIPDS